MTAKCYNEVDVESTLGKYAMLSLIEIKCPHCGAHGQVMLPPVGAIIVGPCPECHNMVVIFAGKALALDNDIIMNGNATARRDHIMQVLVAFLEERISKLVAADDRPGGEAPAGPTGSEMEQGGREAGVESRLEPPAMHTEEDAPKINPFGNRTTAPISRSEVDSFVNVELQLIDDKDYFKAVFE